MENHKNIMGSLTIGLVYRKDYYDFYNDSIPIQIQIFDSELRRKESFWHEGGGSWSGEIESGVKLVRVSIGGWESDRILDILPEKENNIWFPLSEFKNGKNKFEIPKVEEYRDTISFNKEYEELNSQKKIKIRRWEQIWPNHFFYIISDYQNLQFESKIKLNSGGLNLIEIPISDKKSSFVILPKVCKFGINNISNYESSESSINFSVELPNKKGQILLSLISIGDINSAKTLFKVQDAEELLREKRSDPIAAAIGGYFLLKTKELNHLHDWANNLANWFEWLPDGSIIHAWQMILNKEDNTREITDRFLEAVSRGIPVFTEGLRLLYEGLTMLTYDLEHDNQAVEIALKKVKFIMEVADLSKEYTTIVAHPYIFEEFLF